MERDGILVLSVVGAVWIFSMIIVITIYRWWVDVDVIRRLDESGNISSHQVESI